MPRFVPALGGAAVVVAAAVLALNLPFSAGPAVPTIGPQPTVASPTVFTEIAPSEIVEIPDWPLTERTAPPMVWTGAELIVWGDGIYGLGEDGAAFDLAKGTWRVIANAPIEARCCHAAAWTGKEMLVWGGRVENEIFYRDGAAYDPATDTWRLLPPRQNGFSAADPTMVWTGTEAVVVGVGGAAAYDPVTGSWRTLASAPIQAKPLWTGDSIVVAEAGDKRMARYDPAANRWTTIDLGPSAALVGVRDAEGRVTTFVNLPSTRGAPVRLIDGTGRQIAELPAFPGDPGVFGAEISAFGQWVGNEAVFEIMKAESEGKGEQFWALNPWTQAWRRLDVPTDFPRIDDSVVVVGDLILMWNRPGDVYQGRVCCVAPPGNGGSVYRLGTGGPSEVP